jgi:acetyl esterase/lipase
MPNSRLLHVSLLLVASVAAAQSTTKPAAQPLPKLDLTGFREAHPTHLTRQEPPPASWQDPAPLSLPPNVTDVVYASGNLKLHAWMSAVPTDGTPHPAVVFCHGGFWFGNADWNAAAPFIAAGYVVLMPRVRGENGNPGNFEHFYGEVDDVIAAGEHLARTRGVDPKRLFVSGHSAGATLALMAVMKDGPFAMSAPIAPTMGISYLKTTAVQKLKDLVVFDPTDDEFKSRSPAYFFASLRSPVAIFRGDADGTGTPEKTFVANAHSARRAATVTFVHGDHAASLGASLPAVIQAFDHFAPDRHVEVLIPLGWQLAKLRTVDKAFLIACDDAKQRYLIGYSQPKAQYAAGSDLSHFASILRKTRVDRHGEANVTQPRRLKLGEADAIVFDASFNSSDGNPIKQSIYAVELQDYFVAYEYTASASAAFAGLAKAEAIVASTKQVET